ncbi:MAG: hypothetical protein H7X99_00110 [Saprospiraceae bacterium]|nr:hypothetical protein [Saprospiraceae bacterium]
MYKLTTVLFIIIIHGCTDQYEPISFAMRNASSKNCQVILHNIYGTKDSISVNMAETLEMHKDFAPYSGPFISFDSVTVIFEDQKRLTYYEIKGCDVEKSPFCNNTISYHCENMFCVFEIDETEYLKAK